MRGDDFLVKVVIEHYKESLGQVRLLIFLNGKKIQTMCAEKNKVLQCDLDNGRHELIDAEDIIIYVYLKRPSEKVMVNWVANFPDREFAAREILELGFYEDRKSVHHTARPIEAARYEIKRVTFFSGLNGEPGRFFASERARGGMNTFWNFPFALSPLFSSPLRCAAGIVRKTKG